MFVLVVVPLGSEFGDVFIMQIDEGGESDSVLPRHTPVDDLLEQCRVTIVPEVAREQKPCSV